jgi:hypothetical protein
VDGDFERCEVLEVGREYEDGCEGPIEVDTSMSMECPDVGCDERTALEMEQSEESFCTPAIEGDVSEEMMSARWDPVLGDPAAVAETHGVITKNGQRWHGGVRWVSLGEERRRNPSRCMGPGYLCNEATMNDT